MKCNNCNTTIPDSSNICPICGEPQVIRQTIIDAAKAGDENALTDLYYRTSNEVYNTVKFLVKDEDAAQDLLQDSYIKAFRSLDQLEDAAKFPAWIKRIAHNKAIDYLRKSRDVNFSSMSMDDDDAEIEFEDERPESLPEVVIDRGETARLIGEILDALPDDQRACITLFYYDQLSVKEIADELEIPEATVKSRLQYGRRKIEAKVRDLEKKGTKLYGLAPLPFLLLLFRLVQKGLSAPRTELLPEILEGTAAGMQAAAGSEEAAVNAGKNAIESTVNAGSKATGSSAAKAAGSAATKAAGSSAAKAAGSAAAKAAGIATAKAAGTVISGKIIAIIVAAAVVVGAAVAVPLAIQSANRANRPAPQEAVEQAPQDLPPAPEEPPVPSEPATPSEEPGTSREAEEDPSASEASDYASVFESVRAQYEDAMTGNASNPLLSEYWVVQWTADNKDQYGGVRYALHDLNGDGTPEMIMGYPEFYIPDVDTNYTIFEIYAFDRDHAVPLTPYFETKYDYINIDEDGTIATHVGNGGDPNEELYMLPPYENSSYLEHTGTRNIREDVRPKSLVLHFASILTPIN